MFAAASIPISNLYVPDIRPVWRECFRVLRPGGRLLSSFFNPVVFVGDRDPQFMEQGLIRPRFKLPYSDVHDLTPAQLAAKQAGGEALVFGHSLGEQIGGQLEAGFMLKGFYEDKQPKPRFLIDRFLPTFLWPLTPSSPDTGGRGQGRSGRALTHPGKPAAGT